MSEEISTPEGESNSPSSEKKVPPQMESKTETKDPPPAEPPKSPPDSGESANTGEVASPMDNAKKLVEQMAEQNKLFAENLKKAEKMNAQAVLNGTIPAGKEKTQDDVDTEDAKKLLAGTGLSEQLFPEKKDV